MPLAPLYDVSRSHIYIEHLYPIGLTIPDADGGGVFHTNYQDFLYTDRLEVIPLPAALPLFLTGLAGLGAMRRHKRRA